MANYLKVVDSIVTESILADAEFMKTYRDTSPGTWIENTDSIKGVGAIGQQYDRNLNAWYNPQPFPSWTLNTTTFDWEPPIAFPNTAEKMYEWDEENKSWKEIT